uniref:Uncharacterized protein n=1 Tax=Rhizophora mucronata TaxID=61149 RepID=A0A2P2Q648_RHIMU
MVLTYFSRFSAWLQLLLNLELCC